MRKNIIPKPVQNSVSAKAHTPLYTVHRYFARRPHNVFRYLLEHYLKESNALVLDPFAGGGVSIVEALTLGHRAIAFEVNQLATFIIRNELTHVDVTKLRQIFLECIQDSYELTGHYYRFGTKEVYWLAWDSWTNCPYCAYETTLSPATSFKGGVYICESCQLHFRPKLIPANNIIPTRICIVDAGSSIQGVALHPTIVSISNHKLIIREENLYTIYKSLLIATDNRGKTQIPECNLERESALHKKGFRYFEDFFPYKAQAWIDAFASSINTKRIDKKYKDTLFYILSATLRYISRFSTINISWRGEHKPLQWTKSNFWTPYCFVETNPFIAAWDRFFAYERAIDDLEKRFPKIKPKIGSVSSLLSKEKDFSIVNRTSQFMTELPDQSIDLILTDPPYGSYLHYGELSGYWLCWLSKHHPEFSKVFSMQEGEAVPSRKKYNNCKTFVEYEKILTEVFAECFRVLKDNHYLVLSFNNKEPEAWIAFLRSIKKAGFSLPKGGVIFQDGVEAYKRSIDLRREGAIHGDFIYSFVKHPNHQASYRPFNWRVHAEDALNGVCQKRKPISNSNLYLQLNKELLPRLFQALDPENNDSNSAFDDFSLKNLEELINQFLEKINGAWIPRTL